MGALLGSYPGINYEGQEKENKNEMSDEKFRSYLNTYLRENSGLTVKTSRAINCEISSQVSRQSAELISDLTLIYYFSYS